LIELSVVLLAGAEAGEEAEATVGVGTIIVGEDEEVEEEPRVKLIEGAPNDAIATVGTVECS